MGRGFSGCAILLALLPAFAQTPPTTPQSEPACVSRPSGLVSWWPGDDNANDIVGGNQPSDASHVSLAPAKVRRGFHFGSFGYLVIPRSPNLENQQFTLAAWVRPDGPGPENDRNGSVIINQPTNAKNFLELSWSAGTQRFVFSFGSSASEYLVSRDAFPAGPFYYVAGTYDGKAFRLFVNGAQQGLYGETKPIAYSKLGWRIGGNAVQTNFARTWNGLIDELQIYKRALAPKEIQAIFQAGAAGVCMQVAKNRLTDRFRRGKKEVPEDAGKRILLDLLPSPGADPVAFFAREVLLAEMESALGELPPSQREVSWDTRSTAAVSRKSPGKPG